MDALRELAEALGEDGIAVVVALAKAPVRERLDDAGVTAALGGAGAFHPTVRAAVAARAGNDPVTLG
ncbi:hypothetical protein DSM104299_00914 [Baekduia alba]|uniref:hypothetical protein n=1 Tax=Baekduia alba TaxID=2997333 RepID=UPI002341CDA6|nr:hypothetical protein [Baekduia alba]WCB92224.1 hypothetical protein DSM104299_00914 [Baekduia alba]